MPIVEYRCRNSRAEHGEVLWRAHDDKLERVSADGRVLASVPYKKIKRVRLAFSRANAGATRFLMELNGRKSRQLAPHITFEAAGKIDERSSAYFPFVRQIVAGVTEASPGAEFVEGDEPSIYWFLLVANLIVAMLLVAVILAVPISIGSDVFSSVLKSSLIVLSLGLMLSWAIASRPRRFRRRRDLDRFLSARID